MNKNIFLVTGSGFSKQFKLPLYSEWKKSILKSVNKILKKDIEDITKSKLIIFKKK